MAIQAFQLVSHYILINSPLFPVEYSVFPMVAGIRSFVLSEGRKCLESQEYLDEHLFAVQFLTNLKSMTKILNQYSHSH